MKIPLRKLVWILVTMATFSLVANLLAGRLTPNPPDPRLDDLNLNPAQKAQVQEVLEQVQIRAGERDRQGRQRFEEMLTPEQRRALAERDQASCRSQEPPPPERGPAPPPPPPPPERGPAPPPPPEDSACVLLELTPAQCAWLDHLSRQQRLELKIDLEQGLERVRPALDARQRAALLETGLQAPAD